ncbi:MAG: enoyl-CoA hydratase-related protein [Myxococcales bacterium]|nr:enoyl-CoA hydratase-related protein [Myxococcales bacterium]MDD9970241.1 enoyl-CoA hydratase-related protein [Myxococcales bacterium]
MRLPAAETLALSVESDVLHLTLNRPGRKNAMNGQMLDELTDVLRAVDGKTRAVVLRGAGGTFCAGADIKDMASGSGANPAATPEQRHVATARGNRRFGTVSSLTDALSQPVVGVVEGAAMGGGFGLVCVTDIALCHRDAKFGLPETGLGIVPAQIAPFVVERIGLTQARRLALTGARFDGVEAQRLGIVHEVYDDTAALDAALSDVLKRIRRCAPAANLATKRLIKRVGARDLEPILDEAAEVFATASLGDEGREGMLAFVEKRLPGWATED